MKKFDYESTDDSGEVYQLEYMYKSNWEFNGWKVYKNGNYLNYLPTTQFCVNGTNIIIKSDNQAIEVGKMLEKIEAEAESQFFKSHPELNP